jgi:predicted nucleic acid-binding protein
MSKNGLILATMHAHGLTKLASADTDFDRVAWLDRYGP